MRGAKQSVVNPQLSMAEPKMILRFYVEKKNLFYSSSNF